MQDEETCVGLEASTTNCRKERKAGCGCAKSNPGPGWARAGHGGGKSHHGAKLRGPTDPSPGSPCPRVSIPGDPGRAPRVAHQESAALAVVAGPDGAHAAAQLPHRHLPRQPQVRQVGAHLRHRLAVAVAVSRSPAAAPRPWAPPSSTYRGQRGRGLAQLRGLLGAQLCLALRTRRLRERERDGGAPRRAPGPPPAGPALPGSPVPP